MNSRRMLIGLMVWLVASSATSAAVPHLVRYQGKALDSQQVPLEGPYTLKFRLYDAETGGAVVWQETQPNVPMTNGQFSVLLGQVTPLNVDWNVALWLSIQVGTDPELAPRQRITSVPLAIMAEQLATPPITSTLNDDANRLVPVGAIILWTGSACPAGYARVTDLDGKFIAGGTSYNAAAGGSDTQTIALAVANLPSHAHDLGNHAHVISPHTHDIEISRNVGGGTTPREVAELGDVSVMRSVASAKALAGGGGTTAGPSTNTSGATGSGAPISFDNRPVFATVLLCQKN